MAYKVHNLREGGRPCPAGYTSWIDYWEKRTGMCVGRCHLHGNACQRQATDGAHVQLDAIYSNRNWYIVPLCYLHNMQLGQTINVYGPLVPVDPNDPIILR